MTACRGSGGGCGCIGGRLCVVRMWLASIWLTCFCRDCLLRVAESMSAFLSVPVIGIVKCTVWSGRALRGLCGITVYEGGQIFG